MNKHLEIQGLIKIFICWFTTPIGAGLISFLLYLILSGILKKIKIHFLLYDKIMRGLLLFAGMYGAYTLGGNNVANVSGVFYKAGILDMRQALLVGGFSTGLGALIHGRKMMTAIGKNIIQVDAFSAFIAVLSHSVAMHIYTEIGVPISSSQAIVGALLGIGILKGIKTVSAGNVIKIFAGWFITPLIGMGFSIFLYKLLPI
jgi:PiT family inorganic phosphate transporter